MDRENAPTRVRFGVFDLDLRTGELRKSGVRLRLDDQPFHILRALVSTPGDLVTRQQLQDELWPDESFGDLDHRLNAAVKRLRDTLSDSANSPRYVETLPKKGYRFIAPVEAIEVEKGLNETERPSTSRPSRRPQWIVVTAIAVVLVAGVAFLFRGGSSEQDNTRVETRETLLTSYRGQELFPTFSPTGDEIAFAWAGEDEDNWDIYIRQIGAPGLTRLTNSSGRDYAPAWSPDGLHIAFMRIAGQGETELRVIPSRGGPERKLTTMPSDDLSAGGWWMQTSTKGPDSSVPMKKTLAWSPDGQWLAVEMRQADDEPYGIFLIRFSDGEIRRVTTPPPSWTLFGEHSPSFSSDGSVLAFTRNSVWNAHRLFVVELSADYSVAESPREIHVDLENIQDPIWMPGGDEVFFTAGLGAERRLYKFDLGRSDVPVRVDVAGRRCYFPAISTDARRLVFSQIDEDADLFRVRMPRNKDDAEIIPERILHSTQNDRWGQYSRDGSRIAFYSERSGHPEIWVTDSEGLSSRQVTDFNGSQVGRMSWSPDGKQIAFWHESADIYVVSSDGGAPRRLTTDLGAHPSWSSDGNWVYFRSNRLGEVELFKIPAEGGESRQVTHRGGFCGLESQDGSTLFFSKNIDGEGSLWRMTLQSGDEEKIADSVANPHAFAVGSDGVYFVAADKGKRSVMRYNFSDQKIVEVVSGFDGGSDLSVSGDWILYDKFNPGEADLVLIEGGW